jgi:hypothetical protein
LHAELLFAKRGRKEKKGGRGKGRKKKTKDMINSMMY